MLSERYDPARVIFTASTTRECVICVGFVGQSLLSNFAVHVPCIGYDTSSDQIAALTTSRAFSHLPHKVHLTASPTALVLGTHFLIAVPTPLKEDYSVNLDFVNAALRSVTKYASFGSTIVIESSVPVGTTRRLLAPYTHLYHLGMSPERIDPGRVSPRTHEIAKIVSALETPISLSSYSKASLHNITALYSTAFSTVIPVSSPEVAEMTKLYENCYRMINIAYVNEIADACIMHEIDAHEVVSAAATKPFGFQPFTPGIGVGGHCIPVNPFYLFANCNLPLLERATGTMAERPGKLAAQFHGKCLEVLTARNNKGTPDAGTNIEIKPRILVVGIAFKPNQRDVVGSPALAFARTLQSLPSSRLAFYDPLISAAKIPWLEKLPRRRWNRDYLAKEFDGIALCVAQEGVDISVLEGVNGVFVQSYIAFKVDQEGTTAIGANQNEQSSPGCGLRLMTSEIEEIAATQAGAETLPTPPSSALLVPAETDMVTEIRLDGEELLSAPPETHIGLGINTSEFPFGNSMSALVGQVQMA